MIVRREIQCPSCDAEFTIEFDSDNIPSCCPFCMDGLPLDEDLVGVDQLMGDE